MGWEHDRGKPSRGAVSIVVTGLVPYAVTEGEEMDLPSQGTRKGQSCSQKEKSFPTDAHKGQSCLNKENPCS